MEEVETVVALLALLVKKEPEIEKFVRGVVDGHPDPTRRIRDILPTRSRVEDDLP